MVLKHSGFFSYSHISDRYVLDITETGFGVNALTGDGASAKKSDTDYWQFFATSEGLLYLIPHAREHRTWREVVNAPFTGSR